MYLRFDDCMRVWVWVGGCVRACVRACVYACVRACDHVLCNNNDIIISVSVSLTIYFNVYLHNLYKLTQIIVGVLHSQWRPIITSARHHRTPHLPPLQMLSSTISPTTLMNKGDSCDLPRGQYG